MDATTIILAALIGGAAAGLKSVTERALKDAYQVLRDALVTRDPGVKRAIELMEVDPKVDAHRQAARSAIEASHVHDDKEVVLKAQDLLSQLIQHDPDSATAVDINIDEILVMTNVSFEDLSTTGNINIKIGSAKSKVGGFQMKGVTAREAGDVDFKKNSIPPDRNAGRCRRVAR